MKIRVRTYKNEIIKIDANLAAEVIPYQYVMTSPHINKPYEGILYYKGKILPVTGPLPAVWEKSASYDEIPWILVCKDHARVILGLPTFDEVSSNFGTAQDDPQNNTDENFANEDEIANALEEAIAKIA